MPCASNHLSTGCGPSEGLTCISSRTILSCPVVLARAEETWNRPREVASAGMKRLHTQTRSRTSCGPDESLGSMSGPRLRGSSSAGLWFVMLMRVQPTWNWIRVGRARVEGRTCETSRSRQPFRARTSSSPTLHLTSSSFRPPVSRADGSHHAHGPPRSCPNRRQDGEGLE